MTLMHGFGVPAGKFVFALGLALGVFSSGAWGQTPSANGNIPAAGTIPDYSTIIMNQQALTTALQSSSNPERCSGLQPGQNANNSASQVIDQLVQGRLTSAIPGAFGVAANVAADAVRGRGVSALNICPGPGADGSCPALPGSIGELPACTDVSPGGRFSDSAFENLLKPIHDAGCAASCRRTAAEAAKLQMSCLGEEYQKLKESMNSMEDTIRQNLDNQRKYVEAVEAEATRQESIETALVGTPDAPGGKFSDLQRAQTDLDTVITSFQSQIPMVQQQIRNFQADQEIYAQAIQRATVERTNRCFMSEIPVGISVGPCNRGGAPARNVKEFILCRYRQSLEGSTNAGSVVRNQAQQRAELLSNFIEQKFGDGSRFAGGGNIEDPGPGTGTDGGANGRSFGTTTGDHRAELESLIVQSGATGNAVEWMRNLQRKCEEQSTSQINRELSSQGSKPAQWRRRMEANATTILGGAPAREGGAPSGGVIAMINQQGEAVRRAFFVLTNQELGANFQPESCTTIASTNNSGGAQFAQANLNRAGSCVQGLQATVDCLSRGSNCGAQGSSLQAVNVPGVGNIACRFMRECMAAVQQKAMEARSLKMSLRGDGNFRDSRCANGECYGKRKFIREASRKLLEAVRTSSRAFNGHAASLKNQMAALTARLQRGLRISLPRTRPTARQTWDCPNPPASGNASGAEPQVCAMPQPNTGDLIASLTQPVTPDDPADAFSTAETSLDSALSAAQTMEDRVRELRGREAGRKAECLGAEARRSFTNARRNLENALTECQQGHARRETICNESYLNRLQGDFDSISRAASADATGEEEIAQWRQVQGRLRTICNSNRSVGEINNDTNSCGQDERNRDAAQDQRVCGDGGRIDRAGLLGQGALDIESNRVTRGHSDRETGRTDLNCIYTGGEGPCSNGEGYYRDVLDHKCKKICTDPNKPLFDRQLNPASPANSPDHCHVECDGCSQWNNGSQRCLPLSTANMPANMPPGACSASTAAPPTTEPPAAPVVTPPPGNPSAPPTAPVPPAGTVVPRVGRNCPPGTLSGTVCIALGSPRLRDPAIQEYCRTASQTDQAYQACMRENSRAQEVSAAPAEPASPARGSERSRR